MEELLKIASDLAGREVEVEQTMDGKFVVLWMQFGASPPPKGDTKEEALKNFIEYMKGRKNDRSDIPTNG